MEGTDRIDSARKRLLVVIQDDWEQKWKEIAKKIGDSKSGTIRKFADLRVSGIVKGIVAKVDPSKVGATVQSIALIKRKSDMKSNDEIRDRLEKIKWIWGIYHLASTEYDDAVIIRTFSSEELHTVINNIRKMPEVESVSEFSIAVRVKEDPRVVF